MQKLSVICKKKRKKVEAINAMQLDETAISEFKKLYEENYGVSLTNQEALEYGMRLINLVKAVYGNDLPKLNDVDRHKNKEDN